MLQHIFVTLYKNESSPSNISAQITHCYRSYKPTVLNAMGGALSARWRCSLPRHPPSGGSAVEYTNCSMIGLQSIYWLAIR